jgi:hypothetical protein
MNKEFFIKGFVLDDDRLKRHCGLEPQSPEKTRYSTMSDTESSEKKEDSDIHRNDNKKLKRAA